MKDFPVRSGNQTTVRQLRSLMALLLLSSPITIQSSVRAQSDSSGPLDRPSALEPVVVTGEQPGPGMWKIKRNGNVLWILGIYGPLPEKVVWRSREVEMVIAASSEIYTGGGFESYLPGSRSNQKQLIEALKVGHGKTLKDVLPYDLYSQYSVLSEKYARGNKSFDDFRPFYAGQELTRAAVKQMDLTTDGGVDKTVRQLAKRHRIKIHSLTLRDDKSAAKLVAELGALSREEDIPCLRSQLSMLESRINEALIRANAWSVGDIARLRASLEAEAGDSPDACADFLRLTSPVKEGSIEADKYEDDSLRTALIKNKSTLAVIRIERLLRPQGLIDRFRADGYEVEAPSEEQ